MQVYKKSIHSELHGRDRENADQSQVGRHKQARRSDLFPLVFLPFPLSMCRSRLVAEEFERYSDPDLFSSTPRRHVEVPRQQSHN